VGHSSHLLGLLDGSHISIIAMLLGGEWGGVITHHWFNPNLMGWVRVRVRVRVRGSTRPRSWAGARAQGWVRPSTYHRFRLGGGRPPP